jgi:Skp family chaperone for outer membrane proteins
MPKRATRKRPTVRTLERRLARLASALETERARHDRRLAAVRRAADRRLAAMVKEIAALRHHEARAEALARVLGERDMALAAQSERIAELETLLRTPTQLG